MTNSNDEFGCWEISVNTLQRAWLIYILNVEIPPLQIDPRLYIVHIGNKAFWFAHKKFVIFTNMTFFVATRH